MNLAIDIDDVRQVVHSLWGYDSFRPLQHEAIQCALTGRDSVVVLPTGGGKSLCFQAPACCLDGLTVVVSPLISLMKDQVDSLRTNGVAAAFFNSSLTPGQRNDVIESIRSDALKLLYLAPESLLTENVLALLSSVPLAMFAIDEAHCISSWGHDFRPEYRGLRTLKQRFPNVAVHTYTATATERVRQDIAAQLALDQPEILVGSFDRPNLNYRVERKSRGLDQMLEVIERHQGDSGIVYCISRKEVEKTAAALNALGHSAVPYHAGLSDTDRIRNQEAFLEERIDIVVATVAFGMGIDKSNVRFVIHNGMPKSLEAYQQESGRAGRDGLEADCCLFFGGGDFGLWKRLMENSDEANPPALEALQRIDQFCNSTQCRHKSLVEHFGQDFDQVPCNACDFCLDEIEQVDDPLIVAQKILSCIARLEQTYGADYTAQVLAGSNDQRILEKRHDQLSTHGILEEFPKKAIRNWIEQLIGQNCAQKVGEYNQLHLTELGLQVLRGEHTPTLLKPAEKSSSKKSRGSRADDPAAWEGVDRGLFDSLRDLRRELAAEQGVPAYIVFGDATLRDLARLRPTSEAEFLAANGVGQKKCEDYSQRFLEHIAEFYTENSVEVDNSASPKPDRPAITASAIAAFPHFKQGKTISQIAQELSRAESTIQGYLGQFLSHEQITDPSPWVDENSATRIREAIESVGNEKLRPIFDHLNEEVPYHEIRIVATCLANVETS